MTPDLDLDLDQAGALELVEVLVDGVEVRVAAAALVLNLVLADSHRTLQKLQHLPVAGVSASMTRLACARCAEAMPFGGRPVPRGVNPSACRYGSIPPNSDEITAAPGMSPGAKRSTRSRSPARRSSHRRIWRRSIAGLRSERVGGSPNRSTHSLPASSASSCVHARVRPLT
jgi:hypothetical protein